ncbi:phosphoglycerate mutase family protein [Acanthamoeba castellanii str. Neff]|uniref:phosphoglycerate mutase (2,3-diphosphoglycerate-dependent) n=1 Tax=Acanthamoeba castellanii (strain ATCC 30010 / Neff) TaxID=1257118 RepID=L8GZ17_ACACF|nr:phosphoglycerate mutase family protein [Acanthamoeba castellanii str. Neff]ELR18230.1 phosphoglycerate mutase family protein [Acanthamoeba castellanii str. Neff]
MDMPVDLVLVRHAESEGCLAHERSKHGDDSDWQNPDFRNRHTSRYRLSDKGRSQAQIAGQWIKENVSKKFDWYICSEYVRAMETAALLDLDNAHWHTDFFLRERDRGILSNLSRSEVRTRHQEELAREELDPFYHAPPGGESIASVCMRVARVVSHLRQTCSGYKVLLVCHGNIMWGFRITLENIKQAEFLRMIQDPQEKIHNCQILHYSRRNPYNGIVESDINWMRSICPWDEKPDHSTWHRIVRRTFNNTDLLGLVAHIPQAVNNRPEEMDQLSPKRSTTLPALSQKSSATTNNNDGEGADNLASEQGSNNTSLKAVNQDGGDRGRPRKYSLAEY